MFKLTPRRRKELEVWEYFGGWKHDHNGHVLLTTQNKKSINVYESKDGVSPEEAFFSISERGAREVHTTDLSKFLRIWWGKIWAYRHIDIYETGVMDCTMPYLIILGVVDGDRIPRPVAEFLAHSMFQGIDKDLIMKVWEHGENYFDIDEDRDSTTTKAK